MNKICLTLTAIVLTTLMITGCAEKRELENLAIKKDVEQKRILISELKNEGGLYYFQGQPYSGVGFSMYNQTQLKQELNYKNGKLDGVGYLYYENGKLNLEISYQNGKKNGLERLYDFDTGKLEWEKTYKDDKQETEKSFFSDGSLKSEGLYINGMAEGLVKNYYLSGQLMSEGVYSNGRPKEGIVKQYHENGNLRYEGGPFKDGRNNGIENWYFENGKSERELTYKNGRLEGVQKGYNQNGELKFEEIYKDGNLESSKEY